MKLKLSVKSLAVLSLIAGGLISQSALADNGAIVHAQTQNWAYHNCGSPNIAHCQGGGDTGGNGGGGYRPKLTSVFAWDIKTGESWQGWGQPDYVLGAMVDCAEKAKQVHGDPRYCRSHHKNNRHSMVVAMGYDRQTDTYQAVSNYQTRSSGKPDRILRQCQDKGYEGCKIVWVGEKMPSSWW